MRPDLQFDFIADRDTHRLTVRREFAGQRQLVWDCHTRRELLDRWFAPKPLTARTKSMDFRAGGHWHYGMITPDGQSFWSRLDYLSIDPIDGYAAMDGFCDEEGRLDANLPRARWDVSFTDTPRGHTVVTTVVHYQSPEDLQKVMDMGMKEGMTSTMERLDELLAQLGTPSAVA